MTNSNQGSRGPLNKLEDPTNMRTFSLKGTPSHLSSALHLIGNTQAAPDN